MTPNRSTLNLNTVDYPFETLVQRARATPPKLVLDPDFQRKYKWDKDGWQRASKFIESCLMRIPLPSCYFAEDDNGAHLVIDGVQRITTVMRFMNDEFALEGMTSFPDLEGKRFSQLGRRANELESTTIRCIILRAENPKTLIAEIFARLNRGAVSLSDQEIRHALFPGPLNDLLIELASNHVIKNFGLGQQGKSSRDSREAEELILRFFAFYESSDKYEGNLSQFLDKYMSDNRHVNTQHLKYLKSLFEKHINACLIIFDKDEVFSDIGKSRQRQGVIYYDLLMGSLGRYSPDILKAKRNEIRLAFENMCKTDEFKRFSAGGLQRKSTVSQRNKLWELRLQEALGDYP